MPELAENAPALDFSRRPVAARGDKDAELFHFQNRIQQPQNSPGRNGTSRIIDSEKNPFAISYNILQARRPDRVAQRFPEDLRFIPDFNGAWRDRLLDVPVIDIDRFNPSPEGDCRSHSESFTVLDNPRLVAFEFGSAFF